MYRYFVRRDDESEKEVTKEEFCKAERAAGFRPKLSYDHPDYMTTCATGGFSGNNINGRIEMQRLER